MNFIIANKKEVDNFIYEHAQDNHTLKSIKGEPPKGMTFSDGDPVVNKINIGWQCVETGEKVMFVRVPEN